MRGDVGVSDLKPQSAEGLQKFSPVDASLLAVMCIWGYNMIVVKEALAELSPLAFNAVRFAVAALLLAVVLLLRESDIRVSLPDLRWLLLTGVVGNTVYQLFFINGINLSTAGNTAFMVATSPVWVAVLSAVLGLQIPDRRGWVGICISISGVAMVILGAGERITISSQTVWGDLLTLTGAVCWATYTLMTRRVLKRYSPLRVTAYAMVLGTVPLLLISTPSILAQDWTAVSPRGWLAVIYASVLALFAGYLVWSWGVGTLGSTKTAVYNNLTPVVAGILGYILLGEQWTLLRAAGAVFILLGLFLVRTSSARAAADADLPLRRTAGQSADETD